MIENLRKYRGLMIALIVIVVISFFMLDRSHSLQSSGGGVPVMQIAGRTYDDKELNNLGENSMKLAQSLASGGDFDVLQFAYNLAGNGSGKEEEMMEKFFTGRMLLRQAKQDYGIHPGEQEISAYLRKLKVFAGPDQTFNPETYKNFVDKYIGRFGMGEKDLRELISDILATKKLTSIIGAGLTVDRDAVAKSMALENQQITGELAKLDLAPYEEKIQPTEEEIKKSWELLSDSFTTEPRRKFSYILVTPTLPEVKPDEATPEPAEDATLSEDAKKEAAKKRDEEKAKRATAAAEERRKKQLESDSAVDTFFNQLLDQKGTGFEELAKANGWTVATSDLFSKIAAPPELDLAIRSSSRGGKAVATLFDVQELASDPTTKFPPPIAVGENQWLIARLDGEEKSRAKTYEEARAEARAQLISEKGTEAIKAAAADYITKIKALMSAGKSFAEAAKEVGIPTTKAFTAITNTYRPDGASEPQNLFEKAQATDPASIAEPIVESDRTFILYVAKREVVKEPNAAARIDAEVSTRATSNETIAFTSWLAARTEEAKVMRVNRR